MARLKPQQLRSLYDEINDICRDMGDDVEIPALKTFEGEYKQRIFNDGGATSGSIGRYRSASYRKKRRAAGRQIAYKDLSFYGDLLRNIQVGKHKQKNVVGFVNDKSRLIAGYQEKQTSKLIFEPRDSEAKNVSLSIAKGIAQKISRL